MPDRVIAFHPAYAKINYTLDVLGKRDDGYHRLASVMQTIALHDTLALRNRDDGAIALTCDDPALDTPDNLALRAARLLREQTARALRGVTIELHKRIPAQAGLGGGSSDAATALAALDAYWGLHLGLDALREVGARLGSDVPFFLPGGTALIGGRGEVVEPLPPAEPLWIVLAKPPIGLSTAAVFRALTPDDLTGGEDSYALAAAIRAGKSLPLERLSNALEQGVAAAYPQVAATLDALRAAGAPIARMSGSGPTVYAPFRDLAAAAQVHQRMHTAGYAVWLTHTVAAPWSAG
ncbi:MAG TPA: 4-(cytidine 5'-diphospho)-2-C-methyl-D-erythritol kinase [Ktedonobacterales bacterium]|nr:4-(cytidine 5'-diphospho)-2-C-methyl-D-erythritol kinase [Ktedonobacterales bacterium]